MTGKLKVLNLSGIKFGRSKEHVKKLWWFLEKCTEIKELYLNDWGITNGKNFNRILRAVNQWYYLNTIEMVQDFTEQKADSFMENFHYVLSNIERNISVKEFSFMSEEMLEKYTDEYNIINYNRELAKLEDELQKNREIFETYNSENLELITNVSVKHAKIAMNMFKIIEFEFKIEDEDWENLADCLKWKDNKIYGLDFTKPELGEYFHKFLEIMRMDHLYLYFDFINFGNITMGSRKLIKLANFLLCMYPATQNGKVDDGMLFPSSMMTYLFCCQDEHINPKIMKLKMKQLKQLDRAEAKAKSDVKPTDSRYKSSPFGMAASNRGERTFLILHRYWSIRHAQ